MSEEKVDRITLTPAEMAAMPQDALNNLLLRATKIEATFVVRRKDGTIKYDDPSLAGTYGEENINGGT